LRADRRTAFFTTRLRQIFPRNIPTALAVALGLSLTVSAYGIDPQTLEAMISDRDYEAALELIDAEIAASTSDPVELLFVRARVVDAAGNVAQAEHAYRELITRYPARPESYNNLARIYANQGKLDQASSLLRAGLYTHPSYRVLFDNLTQIYTEQAARSLRAALDPKDPKADPQQPLETLMEIPALSRRH
tara:strand:+ start:34640 stop:35212 length:573 start_codon:yes stop_codon:yes gene_type:complete